LGAQLQPGAQQLGGQGGTHAFPGAQPQIQQRLQAQALQDSC
jgi:hypothetical protein